MKILNIIIICFIASFSFAEDTYLIWRNSTGNIITHGDAIIAEGKKIWCGDRMLGGYSTNKLSAGSVDPWVEGATNISQLPGLVTLDWEDVENGVDTTPVDIKAMIEVVAHFTSNSVNDVKQKFKQEKKNKKK